MKNNTRELSELGQEISRDKTILLQIAIELGLLEDKSLYQYDFTDCGIWGSNDSYAIISPQQNTIIRIPKNVNEFENLPVKIYKKLEEYGFIKSETSTSENVNNLRDLCYKASFDAGWHTNLETGELLERNKAEMLCLIHSEISEAMEGERKGLMDDHLPDRPMAEVELADAVIRIMDYAGRWGYDIGGALVAKVLYNKNRKDHKLENRIKDGGKKF